MWDNVRKQLYIKEGQENYHTLQKHQSYYIFGISRDQILIQTLNIMLCLSPTIQILRYYLKLYHKQF
jgi:hypothetical protein